jgi:DNA-binding transcriptional LysR family regulator
MIESIRNNDLPLGVEVRHLASLHAIAETRSFSQAAAQLGYAQSAVSQQIAALERAVGHRLVERPGGPRPVSLTEAGEVLLRHAIHITARLGAAKADLDALAAGEAGVLRVGTFQSASARLLPPTLLRFRRDFPQIGVELRNELVGTGLGDLVGAGQVDLAFMDLADLSEPLDSVELICDPYVAIVPPDSPLVERGEVEIARLDGARFVSSTTDDACALRIADLFDRSHVQPQMVFRSDDNLTAQRLVASGLGMAIVPLLAVEFNIADACVAVLPLATASALTRRIGIAWHSDRLRSKAAESFVATAQEAATVIHLPQAPALTAPALTAPALTAAALTASS